jgi:hypothetical protein
MTNTNFRKKDRVFDIEYGWGMVYDIVENERCIIKVIFDDNCKRTYLYDGKYPCEGGYPRKVLSFTEYTLEGFSQDRPEELPDTGQVVWVKNNDLDEWRIQQFVCKEDKKYKTTLENPFNWQSYFTLWNFITTKNPFI